MEEILIHQYDNNKELIRTTRDYGDMSKALLWPLALSILVTA